MKRLSYIFIGVLQQIEDLNVRYLLVIKPLGVTGPNNLIARHVIPERLLVAPRVAVAVGTLHGKFQSERVVVYPQFYQLKQRGADCLVKDLLDPRYGLPHAFTKKLLHALPLMDLRLRTAG